jgi:hypothetical protein
MTNNWKIPKFTGRFDYFGYIFKNKHLKKFKMNILINKQALKASEKYKWNILINKQTSLKSQWKIQVTSGEVFTYSPHRQKVNVPKSKEFL